MTLIRWNRGYSTPFSLLQSLHDDISRVLEETTFGTFSPLRWGLNAGAFVPPVDLYDAGDHLVVRADLPGLKKDAIEVSVVRNTLSIRGEKKAESGDSKTRTERTFGSFSRSIALPVHVDAEHVTAAYRNGILEVTLPKSQDAKPHKIAVNT